MKTEKKAFRITDMQVKADDAGAMTISGYGSTFGGDPDAYRDLIAPGAFAQSLRERTPKMLYQHDSRQLCGVWDKACEDSKGLYLEGRFINTPLGLQVYEEAKAGAIDSMSIGYSTVKYSFDDATDVRTLQEVKLWEVSLVTFPANENAIITNVKDALTTEREFERFLREAGYSREQAKAITARGFKALADQREAEPDLTPLLTRLTQFENSFR